MTDTKPAEALEAARNYLNSIRGDHNPDVHTALAFDAFAERWAAEAPKPDALAFADWILEFLVGYKTWAIEENRLALAQRIDAFAERRVAEVAEGPVMDRAREVFRVAHRAHLHERPGGKDLTQCETEAVAVALTAAEDKAPRAAILECADTCRALGHYSGHNVQPAIEQIADAILALADKPAAGKGEP